MSRCLRRQSSLHRRGWARSFSGSYMRKQHYNWPDGNGAPQTLWGAAEAGNNPEQLRRHPWVSLDTGTSGELLLRCSSAASNSPTIMHVGTKAV